MLPTAQLWLLETLLILLTSPTAAAQTATNRVEFTFTVAAQGKAHDHQTTNHLTKTIVDTGTSTASDKVFVAGDVVGAGGSGSTTALHKLINEI